MRESFYRYLMTDYHEISHYLELNATYLPSMSVFDEAWQGYLEEVI